jgi:tRNA (guanine-N7-)-methyltransferase
MNDSPDRKRKLYGRRKGPKLSAHQQQLLDRLLPQLQVKLRAGADPNAYFSPPPCGEVDPRSGSGGEPLQDIWLEIGFGGGEHLFWQAQHHPKVGIIGAEPFVNGVVKLLSKVVSQGPPSVSLALRSSSPPPPQAGEDMPSLAYPPPFTGEVDSSERSDDESGGGNNIRIHTGDAREVIESLPDASLGRVFILFPDPWPKTRHHKRRFVQMEMLDELSRVMKPGAELRFASDDAGYVEWTLERVLAHPSFEWTATRAADWKSRPSDWPPTRYEVKALHGPPVYLRFVRSDCA